MLWTIKSARFPCNSLLWFVVYTLDTADFLKGMELGLPSVPPFFHTYLIALSDWMRWLLQSTFKIHFLDHYQSHQELWSVLLSRKCSSSCAILSWEQFLQVHVLRESYDLSQEQDVFLCVYVVFQFPQFRIRKSASPTGIVDWYLDQLKVSSENWPIWHILSLAAWPLLKFPISFRDIKACKSSSIFFWCCLEQPLHKEVNHCVTYSFKDKFLSVEMSMPRFSLKQKEEKYQRFIR